MIPPVRVLWFTLLITPLLPAQNPNAAKSDGLAILRNMSQHYAAAKSWYIVATQERTSWNEYSRDWSKSTMIGAVSANRYHFEGHSQFGSALHVSDGETAWDLHPEEHAYTREAPPPNGYKPPSIYLGNESAAQDAARFLKEFSELASRLTGAKRLPDESITVEGQKIPCYVVRLTSEQLKGPHSEMPRWQRTLWIAKSTWTVRRRLENSTAYMTTGPTIQMPIRVRSVTTYSTVDLNGTIPQSLFRFIAPHGATLVASFNENTQSPWNPQFASLLKKPAPNVTLVNAEGRLVPLASYRGKPVLLDFWATWCAPCVAATPNVAEIEKEAGPKGLVLLAIDEDKEAKKATDYLAKHQDSWPDTHDDGKINDAFGSVPLPTYVLIDREGKVVYVESGFHEQALRKAIAELGPQFASVATPKRQPCETASR